MGHFSNLDTALSEKQHGRGREALSVGSIGVCLDDSGFPLVLYSVSTLWSGGLWVTIENIETGEEKTIQPDDFWALT